MEIKKSERNWRAVREITGRHFPGRNRNPFGLCAGGSAREIPVWTAQEDGIRGLT